MLISQLNISNYPVLNLFDKVSLALQLMEEYETQHLPVVADEKYVGLVSKDDLLDEQETTSLVLLEHLLIKPFVQQHEHFFSALKLASDLSLTLVPVLTAEKELQGIITQKELLHAAGKFNGVEEPGGIIVLEMEKRSFSFGELTRLVETNDANITQLNTSADPGTGNLTITIKLNRMEISDILATFQRYDYSVLYYFGEEAYENELKENYDLLMAYLKI